MRPRHHQIILRIRILPLGLGLLWFVQATAFESVPPDVALAALAHAISVERSEAVLCVRIGSNDPPAEMLRTLRRANRTVLAASQCQWRVESIGSYEIRTGLPAHFLSVSAFHSVTPEVVQVTVEDHFHGKWGALRIEEYVFSDSLWRWARAIHEVDN
jgi:hypothetical protein